MMKIVVVEDEIKKLKGLISLINNLDADFEVVGQAKNGEEGAIVILDKKPDIVITDITMPVLNGLDMIKKVNEHNFLCKYIILSGYADFEYAQEALKLGSVDYLLKPITQEDLLKALNKVKAMIHNEASQIFPSSYTSEELFQRIITTPFENCTEFFEELGHRIENTNDMALLMIRGDTSFTNVNKEKFKTIINHYLASFKYYLCFKDTNKEIFVLIQYKQDTSIIDVLEQIHKRCLTEIRDYIVFSLYNFKEFDLLNKAIKRVQDNSHWNLSLKEPKVIHGDFIQSLICSKFTYPSGIERNIVNKISSKNITDIEKDLDAFIEYLHRQIYSYSDIREALICLTVAALYAIRKATYGIYEEIEHLNILDWVRNILFTSSYRNMMTNILMQFDLYNQNIKQSNHPIINKVLQIIDREYKSDLALDDIAGRLNITPEYLSSLFIKEIGVKFKTYCTQKRIETAKKLLQNESIKIYEVAEASGYTDVKYFCKVFKKYTGISPSEYLHSQH